jgi:TfoX/Sxy family transcriptional regulator of competence genes
MATERTSWNNAADQMRGAGEIAYRKMFGEYGVYCDGNSSRWSATTISS